MTLLDGVCSAGQSFPPRYRTAITKRGGAAPGLYRSYACHRVDHPSCPHRRRPHSCTAFAVATRHFSRFPFARSIAALILGRCRHPRGPSIPDPGPVYPRPRSPSIPNRYSWKQRSTYSSCRACHPHACGACPSASYTGKPAPRHACRRTPLLRVSRADASAVAALPHACSGCACLLWCPTSSDSARISWAPLLRVHCIDAAADQLPLPLQFSTTRWKWGALQPPIRFFHQFNIVLFSHHFT